MDVEVASAHERMVEQVMSDERLLGALPEDAAGRLLDWAVQRLTAAAEAADSLAAYEVMADAIRGEARQTADAVADQGGDLETLERQLATSSIEASSTVPVAAEPWTAPDEIGATPPSAAETDATAVETATHAGAEPAPVEPALQWRAAGPADDGRTPDSHDELRDALEDAVERVRSLFRWRRDPE